MPRRDAARQIEIVPLTPDRWRDLDALFGPRGATGGCWCMWWRLPRAEYRTKSGDENRRAFRKIVGAGPPPGLIAYVEGEPAAWCAIAPRAALAGLERSRMLARVDDEPVWSLPCFFVARKHRRRGLTQALIEAALAFAREQGARIIEAYPVEPGARADPGSAFTGTASTFLRSGFSEVARRAPARPIVRRRVRAAGSARGSG